MTNTQTQNIGKFTGRIKVTMIDCFTGAEVIRFIDHSNVDRTDGIGAVAGIKIWIAERANAQHETILDFKSWVRERI